MKLNIPLINGAMIVLGVSALAFAKAEQFAPLRTAPEKWGYGVGFTMLGLLGSVAFWFYLAGRGDGTISISFEPVKQDPQPKQSQREPGHETTPDSPESAQLPRQ